ncbi:hypothetical protein GPECTOR_95g691 [Gonium pectorale]|uniref:Uncharacterized protein n=1 Tax=Gonium pectorale TaxID=33097 RepID=A0A150G0C6_GONPE|nr:hypothetical protein GPECTOR_95g691 [Gonium pectorale]|eukprot:KXZ43302.1 hypothetical protein GPECTOR_95g691 [Gonium pectorale]
MANLLELFEQAHHLRAVNDGERGVATPALGPTAPNRREPILFEDAVLDLSGNVTPQWAKPTSKPAAPPPPGSAPALVGAGAGNGAGPSLPRYKGPPAGNTADGSDSSDGSDNNDSSDNGSDEDMEEVGNIGWRKTDNPEARKEMGKQCYEATSHLLDYEDKNAPLTAEIKEHRKTRSVNQLVGYGSDPWVVKWSIGQT